MVEQNPFKALLKSRKFWLAMFGLVQSLVFELVPGFPREVWLAIDGLVAVVIAGIAYEDGQQKRAG